MVVTIAVELVECPVLLPMDNITELCEDEIVPWLEELWVSDLLELVQRPLLIEDGLVEIESFEEALVKRLALLPLDVLPRVDADGLEPIECTLVPEDDEDLEEIKLEAVEWLDVVGV